MPGKRARPVRVGGDLHTQAPRRRPTGTLWDAEWGPAFWKVNCYAPFPVWIW